MDTVPVPIQLPVPVPVCGAVRDRNELKYISALGQTGQELRCHGTFKGKGKRSIE